MCEGVEVEVGARGGEVEVVLEGRSARGLAARDAHERGEAVDGGGAGLCA